MIAIIITYLKEKIDKLYYSKYTLGQRGTLIRTMFPWITKVWEYSRLEEYLITTSPTELNRVIWFITSFYWWEVSRLTANSKFEEIKRYQGLIDLCQSLKDYSEEAYNLNNQ